ncbi:MAG: hypothetical protein JWM59_4233 [Verrucomicrobiales bacterium]|nr:hypothetical protein [Verrucomicrobiales bacterium]
MLTVLAAGTTARAAREPWQDFKAPPHNYWSRPVTDRFSLLKASLESGAIPLDSSSEKAFVVSLLGALKVPVSSQMLVFSATSLQLPRISLRNPRALYFTDDLYVGWVPGGQLEIVSLDPALGGIYYIMDVPRRTGGPMNIERSTRCMNCHGATDTGFVPGLVLSSVIPGANGGSLISFRQETLGHGVPLSERFGGWLVTGLGSLTEHHGNVTGRLSEGNLTTTPVEWGTTFDPGRYPSTGSDLLPQLLHEHQAGFITQVLEATYRSRVALQAGNGTVPPDREEEMNTVAEAVTRYLLFRDEVPLPAGGVAGEPAFLKDFTGTGRLADSEGRSLRDLDLKNRMLRHRCSYMIHSPVFTGLPPDMKSRVFARMRRALDPAVPDGDYAYLGAGEKTAIRSILKATLKDLPTDW